VNYYKRNKAKAVFINTEPTKTDQSQAHDTDVNVIVRKFVVTGTVQGNAATPMYGDFTNLPRDLRSLLDESRSINRYRSQLPQQLKEMPIEQLLALTEQELANILKPEDKPKEEVK